ncbi:ESPR-type extended signal peptide-containing protein, partial [Burkholderia ubonensis]|uniref:ESPR-type extended signal peptide-containing protein n=1 Tax=Burkholderia ubonensis TaxID=101571 RepID=UPI0012FA54EF
MNKNRYRVVFNRARGAMIVVQENGNAPRAAGIAHGRCCINQSRHGDVYAQRSGVKPLLTI